MNTYNVLSIDAWAYDNGWNWNAWHPVGEIEVDIDGSARHILKSMRDAGFLASTSAGLCEIDDDGYNIVICERSNHRPLFAIEYGPAE